MKATVEIRTAAMGDDMVFLVTGGTAHIGASATAYLDEDGSVRTDAGTLPGHREGPLAAELAGMAADALKRTVVVIAGIHLNNPSRGEIEAVVAEARRLMQETLRLLGGDARGGANM